MARSQNSSPPLETPASSSRTPYLAPIKGMVASRQNCRPGDPPQSDNLRSERLLKFPGMLSLNIFYQRKKLSLCMSNCKSIEVTVFFPSVSPGRPKDSKNLTMENPQHQNQNENQELEFESKISELNFNMSATQLSVHARSISRDTIPPPQRQTLGLLDLPLELRLKIYTYLLPSRTHTITTQIPHNGYFYNSSTKPLHTTTFYPFGRRPPPNLTTYKVLSTNFRNNFPEISIHTQLLLVCRQIKEEAEALLYGAVDAVWDFGTSVEAVAAFWGDRSQTARECVRVVKVAREIPDDGSDSEWSDHVWENFCTYVAAELPNLRTLDLTIWSSSGSIATFPSWTGGGYKGSREKRCREWDWISGLLDVRSLRNAQVTWWGFQVEKEREGRETGFDSWLARRMVGDKLVRDRMIREGVVVEGIMVLTGGQS